MGWGIKLSDAQWEELDRIRFSTPSSDVFRNCLIILMSDSRDTIDSITERLGCHRDTVVRVRRLYRKGGVNALRPAKPQGRRSRATPEYISALRLAVKANPMSLGYGFSTWSAARLAAHLAKITGVAFSADQVQRLLHRHGFSVQRPKHTLKGKRNERAYRKSRKELVVRKKSL